MKTLFLKLIVFLLIVMLGFSACEKDDKGQNVSYYKTIGKGYIFDGDSNTPLKNVRIDLFSTTAFIDAGLFTMREDPNTNETFIADENGYFQVRFAKYVSGRKVKRYKLEIDFSSENIPKHWYSIYGSGWLNISPKDLKGKKTISLDTIKFYRYENQMNHE